MPSIRLVISDDTILPPKQHSHTAVLFDRQAFAHSQNKFAYKDSLRRHFLRNQSTETEFLFFLFEIKCDFLEIWYLVLDSNSFPLVELAVEHFIHDSRNFIRPIITRYFQKTAGPRCRSMLEINQHLLLSLECVLARGLYDIKTLHSAFFCVCEKGNYDFLELFATVREFDVNFVNSNKETGLIIFARNANYFSIQAFAAFVEAIFLAFPNLAYNAKDYTGNTAMCYITSHNKRTILADFIQEREECIELKRITLFHNKSARFLTKDVVTIIQQFLTHKTPYMVQKPLIPLSILEENERVESLTEEEEFEEEELDVDNFMALELEGLHQAAHWEGGDAEDLDAEEFVWQDEEEEEEEEEMIDDNDPLHVIPAPPIPGLLRNKLKTRQILLTECFGTSKRCVMKPTMKKTRQLDIREWLKHEFEYEPLGYGCCANCQCDVCATPFGVRMYI